jgi:DNA-binding Lrp family transcriptional regulator
MSASREPSNSGRLFHPFRRTTRAHPGPPCQYGAILLSWPRPAEGRTEARMVPFFVQIKCRLGQSYEVANKLADAEIASEIYSTAGNYDIIAKFHLDPDVDIGHFVAQKVQTIPEILDTRTMITFKAF